MYCIHKTELLNSLKVEGREFRKPNQTRINYQNKEIDIFILQLVFDRTLAKLDQKATLGKYHLIMFLLTFHYILLILSKLYF